MPCKTKPRQSSRESLRMVRLLPPDTPRPPKYQPELRKNSFSEKLYFQFFCSFCNFVGPVGPFFHICGGWGCTIRTFPRTLAGFGLTGHWGSRFSCFLEILETHFITTYLQIGPRASRLVLDCFFQSQGTISGAIK